MLFKNWPQICEIENPIMRLWISYEENQATLSKVQLGFPHLFTDTREEGKTGPFPLSHLRRLMNEYDLKSEHAKVCEWEEEAQCSECRHYSRLPDFPVPILGISVERIPKEIWDQLKTHFGSDIQPGMYFPYKLYEINHLGETFYLGDIDLLGMSLVVKSAVHIDT